MTLCNKQYDGIPPCSDLRIRITCYFLSIKIECVYMNIGTLQCLHTFLRISWGNRATEAFLTFSACCASEPLSPQPFPQEPVIDDISVGGLIDQFVVEQFFQRSTYAARRAESVLGDEMR